MRGRSKALGAVLSIAVLAGILTGAQAGATAKSAVVSKQVADPQAALDYWTEARMRAAVPAPLPEVDPGDPLGAVATGTPVKFPGTPTTTRAPARMGSASGEVFEGGRVIPFKRFEIEDPTQSPYLMHGQIFGRSAAGFGIGCSGTVVQSENESVVWTAAHCLYSFGEYRKDFVFIPAYKDGPSEYGTWAASEILIPAEYEANEDLAHDFGVLVMAPNDQGQTVGDAVGMRGIAFNQSPAEAFQSFGYPAAPPHLGFDGERMISCQSQGSGRVFDVAVSMGCDMQDGSSGGGWIMRGGFLASNQSGGSPGTYPDIAWGPYLGATAKKLYDEARGGSGPLPQPTPTTPAGPKTTHEMKVNLKLVHATTPDGQPLLIAKGRVRAVDDYPNCNHLTPVRVVKYKKSNRTYYPVGTLAFANAEGRWAMVIPDQPGKYLAAAEESPYDLQNNCAADYTDPLRHLH